MDKKPLVNFLIVYELEPLIYPLEMVMFYSYVKLPEGNHHKVFYLFLDHYLLFSTNIVCLVANIGSVSIEH